jgi:hypothetical protein
MGRSAYPVGTAGLFDTAKDWVTSGVKAVGKATCWFVGNDVAAGVTAAAAASEGGAQGAAATAAGIGIARTLCGKDQAAPAPPKTDYTPWLIGGAAFLGFMLLKR